MVKWISKESSKDHRQVILPDPKTNQQCHTILGTINRKLDPKKDFEVSQGELGDRFSRS